MLIIGAHLIISNSVDMMRQSLIPSLIVLQLASIHNLKDL